MSELLRETKEIQGQGQGLSIEVILRERILDDDETSFHHLTLDELGVGPYTKIGDLTALEFALVHRNFQAISILVFACRDASSPVPPSQEIFNEFVLSSLSDLSRSEDGRGWWHAMNLMGIFPSLTLPAGGPSLSREERLYLFSLHGNRNRRQMPGYDENNLNAGLRSRWLEKLTPSVEENSEVKHVMAGIRKGLKYRQEERFLIARIQALLIVYADKISPQLKNRLAVFVDEARGRHGLAPLMPMPVNEGELRQGLTPDSRETRETKESGEADDFHMLFQFNKLNIAGMRLYSSSYEDCIEKIQSLDVSAELNALLVTKMRPYTERSQVVERLAVLMTVRDMVAADETSPENVEQLDALINRMAPPARQLTSLLSTMSHSTVFHVDHSPVVVDDRGSINANVSRVSSPEA